MIPDDKKLLVLAIKAFSTFERSCKRDIEVLLDHTAYTLS